jgi:hypothetical protein
MLRHIEKSQLLVCDSRLIATRLVGAEVLNGGDASGVDFHDDPARPCGSSLHMVRPIATIPPSQRGLAPRCQPDPYPPMINRISAGLPAITRS